MFFKVAKAVPMAYSPFQVDLYFHIKVAEFHSIIITNSSATMSNLLKKPSGAQFRKRKREKEESHNKGLQTLNGFFSKKPKLETSTGADSQST